MKSPPSVADVRKFWESNPLWTGESAFPPGTREFFEEHRRVVVDDCLAGQFAPRFLPPPDTRDHVLDLGCGPGFWTVELALAGCGRVESADLTERALELTRQRCALYGVPCESSLQNAEHMTYPSGRFSHVNCQGVIHHTPDTEACVREIHRVLRPGGTASVSVYYRNVFLRAWPLLKWPVKALRILAPRLKGRGRESIAVQDDADEIVRLYDGADNPLGKAFSRARFRAMLEPFFDIEGFFYHLFPARALPFRVPRRLHRWLDRRLGFMIVARLRKKTL